MPVTEDNQECCYGNIVNFKTMGPVCTTSWYRHGIVMVSMEARFWLAIRLYQQNDWAGWP